MTEIEKLLALEEIKKLRARYFECTDCKDWKGFLEVFAPDVEFDHRNSFKAVDPVSGQSRVYGKPELLANAGARSNRRQWCQPIRRCFNSAPWLQSADHGQVGRRGQRDLGNARH